MITGIDSGILMVELRIVLWNVRERRIKINSIVFGLRK